MEGNVLHSPVLRGTSKFLVTAQETKQRLTSTLIRTEKIHRVPQRFPLIPARQMILQPLSSSGHLRTEVMLLITSPGSQFITVRAEEF